MNGSWRRATGRRGLASRAVFFLFGASIGTGCGHGEVEGHTLAPERAPSPSRDVVTPQPRPAEKPGPGVQWGDSLMTRLTAQSDYLTELAVLARKAVRVARDQGGRSLPTKVDEAIAAAEATAGPAHRLAHALAAGDADACERSEDAGDPTGASDLADQLPLTAASHAYLLPQLSGAIDGLADFLLAAKETATTPACQQRFDKLADGAKAARAQIVADGDATWNQGEAIDDPTLHALSALSGVKRRRYLLNNSWFEGVRAGWDRETFALRGSSLQVLEIGSFEGASASWFLDELMGHPAARLTAIDTFAGSMEHKSAGDIDYGLAKLEERFLANVAATGRLGQVRVIKGASHDVLPQLRQAGEVFDFVYIDGSHVAADVLTDATDVWPLVKVGGTIVFDDYEWYAYKQPFYNPHIAIDAFIDCFEPELVATPRNGQMWLKKVANASPAESW